MDIERHGYKYYQMEERDTDVEDSRWKRDLDIEVSRWKRDIDTEISRRERHGYRG